jgi:hypothetical protein
MGTGTRWGPNVAALMAAPTGRRTPSSVAFQPARVSALVRSAVVGQRGEHHEETQRDGEDEER